MTASAGEMVRLRTNASLLSRPAAGAQSTGSVRSGASAEIVERKGFWVQLRSGRVTGWTKLTSVVLAQGGAGRDVAALASGRTGRGNVVSSSGGRGLDNGDDLTSATPNPAAVADLSRLAVSADAAGQFANAGGLRPRNIPYTKPPASGSRGGQP